MCDVYLLGSGLTGPWRGSSNTFVDEVYPFSNTGWHNGVHMVVDTTWLEVSVAKISDQLE